MRQYCNVQKTPKGRCPHSAFVHTLWRDTEGAGNAPECWSAHRRGREWEQLSVEEFSWSCSSTELPLWLRKHTPVIMTSYYSKNKHKKSGCGGFQVCANSRQRCLKPLQLHTDNARWKWNDFRWFLPTAWLKLFIFLCMAMHGIILTSVSCRVVVRPKCAWSLGRFPLLWRRA